MFSKHKETKDTLIKYKIILKDGGIFNGIMHNTTLYAVTEFAVLNVRLTDMDSVEIGILPDFRHETKIYNLLMKLSFGSDDDRRKAYEKLIRNNIGTIPIVRNYIDNQENKKQVIKDTKYTPENVLNGLMKKYNTDRNFTDKDVIYMHSNYKLGGILSVKKKRALLRFNKFTFSREAVRKIIILHAEKISENNKPLD